MDSLEILNPNALIAFLSSRASIDLQVKHVCDYWYAVVYVLIHVNWSWLIWEVIMNEL